MLKYKCSFLIITYFALAVTAGRVPFITRCKGTDNDCIRSSAKAALPFFIKGLPDLGVPPAEPLVLKDYSTQFDKLTVQLKDMKLYGLPKVELQNIERDLGKSTLTSVLELPVLIKGLYEMSGEILGVNIEGKGDLQLSTDKVVVNIKIKLEAFEKEGKKYYKLKDLEYTYKFKERVVIKLENLFGGDKEKAEPVLKVLNEGWEFLIGAIGEPLIKDLVEQVVFGHIDKFFQNVPAEELEIA